MVPELKQKKIARDADAAKAAAVAAADAVKVRFLIISEETSMK
jgi:hypothetical protein